VSDQATHRGIVSVLRERLRRRAGHAGHGEVAADPGVDAPRAAPAPLGTRATAGNARETPAPDEAAAPLDDRARARSFWNEKHAQDVEDQARPDAPLDPIDYTRHWFLYNHAVSKPLTGDCAKYWLDEIGRKHLTPRPERMLALGCGPAFIEQQILERDLAGRIVAYDTSEVAIAAARQRLDATPWGDRIELRCGDFLTADIPDRSFDAVFVEAALHHFLDLEATFRLMHRVLKPEGLLLYEEYVGPDLQQYPPELEQLLGRINACLAPDLRRDFETGEVRTSVDACPIEVQMERDPTEGVHASEILPLTYRYFEVVDRRDYGGAIVRPLFNRILRNWDLVNDPKDQTIAQLVVLLEQELLRAGVIPTHNTIVVARPRRTPLAPLSAEQVARIAYADWPGLDASCGTAPRSAGPR